MTFNQFCQECVSGLPYRVVLGSLPLFHVIIPKDLLLSFLSKKYEQHWHFNLILCTTNINRYFNMGSLETNLCCSIPQLISNDTLASIFNSVPSHDRKPENWGGVLTNFKFIVLKWCCINLHHFLLICNSLLCQGIHYRIIKL